MIAHGTDEGTTASPSRVAIIVVTYNSAGVLGHCLKSLVAGCIGARLARVVVVDNASRDDSVRVAREMVIPATEIVELGRNVGYAAAINAGVKVLNTEELDAIMVLNPDCRVGAAALAVLAKALQRPACGIAVPRLVHPDGTLVPSLRRHPAVFRAAAEAVLGVTFAGRTGSLGELIRDPREYGSPCTAAWATGAAMLISTACLMDTGPWDESFLLYSEETEFALRAADKGWSLWYDPAAVVEHIGGESRTDPTLAALLAVNKVRLFRRRHNTPTTILYYLAIVSGEAIRALAGRQASRAALVALIRPSRRIRQLAH